MSDASLDFQTLRDRGLARLQKLTGDRWTDYNLHDPGVTLLEALVYGLTDVAYRLELPTADLLTGPQGLDLDRLALLRPERALPCRPTTGDDVRAALLDALPDVDDVWVSPVIGPGDRPTGLVEVFVAPEEPPTDALAEDLLARARVAFHAVRGVGQDAVHVDLVRIVPCRLDVALEVERRRSPERIVAEVYERCAALLHNGPRPIPFDALRRSGQPLDEVFDGPLGRFGLYDRRHLDRAARALGPADLGTRAPQPFFRAVGEIAGVAVVKRLAIVPLGAQRDEAAHPVVLRLGPPDLGIEGDRIELSSRGRLLDVNGTRVGRLRRRLAVERARAMRLAQDAATIRATPVGRHRDVAAYTLVQHHLPAAYGVDRRGLPRSAGRAARERASQLRGYLLQAEQPMADLLAQLAALRDVFARSGVVRTYATASDLSLCLPEMERDLLDASAMADAVAARDDVIDRRGRVLDYLLALYGERFSQHSLQTFDVYRSPAERAAAVVANREAFLADVEALTRDRGGGPDLARRGASADAPQALGVGGFARRLARLLDMHAPSPWQWLGLTLAEHDLEWGRAGDGLADCERETTPPAETFETLVPVTDDGVDERVPTLMRWLREDDLLPAGPIDPRVLAAAVDVRRFRLDEDGAGWRLSLDLGQDVGEEGIAWRGGLGRFRSHEAAIAAANRLRRAAIALARASEGLHVVEHVLLRPRRPNGAARPDVGAAGFRLTVVMPGWTPRLAQPGMRDLIVETVRLNCPAHVVPYCLWVEDIERMLDFELAHATWRDALAAYLTRPQDDVAAEVDGYAHDLALILGLDREAAA